MIASFYCDVFFLYLGFGDSPPRFSMGILYGSEYQNCIISGIWIWKLWSKLRILEKWKLLKISKLQEECVRNDGSVEEAKHNWQKQFLTNVNYMIIYKIISYPKPLKHSTLHVDRCLLENHKEVLFIWQWLT